MVSRIFEKIKDSVAIQKIKIKRKGDFLDANLE